MSSKHPHRDETAASPLDDAFNSARSLGPEDRLRLIARLWASLPADHWAAPSEQELLQLQQRLSNVDCDGLADVPWKIVRQMAGSIATQPPPAKTYSAPRRFDLATIFVVTSAYSLLFALFSYSDALPIVSVMIGGFITLVGLGQALLFSGKKPRVASIVTGSLTYVVLAVAYWIYEDRMRSDEFIVIVLLANVVVGAVTGYIAGVLVGGVFLIADLIRHAYGNARKEAVESTHGEEGSIPTLLHHGDEVELIDLVPIANSAASWRESE